MQSISLIDPDPAYPVPWLVKSPGDNNYDLLARDGSEYDSWFGRLNLGDRSINQYSERQENHFPLRGTVAPDVC